MKKLKTLLAVAAVALAPSAFATSGFTTAFTNAQFYPITFTGDGAGTVVAQFSGSGITGVSLDGIALSFVSGQWTTGLGGWNYLNNTHGFQVFGSGPITGYVSWDDAVTSTSPITAVPEPTNAMMLLAGLAALGAVSRRRRVK